jgi:hypothetical protein
VGGKGFKMRKIVTPSHRYRVPIEKLVKMMKGNMEIVDKEEEKKVNAAEKAL